MATFESCTLEAKLDEKKEIGLHALDLGVSANDDTEVNIAVVGKAGSGRSSFVNTIRGVKESHKNAARTRKREENLTTSKGKEHTSFSHPTNPNVKFSILPRLDKENYLAFQPYLEYVDIEKFNAFLIFTAQKFSKRHLLFAKRVKARGKALFLIRTKIDNDCHPEKQKEEFKEEKKLGEIRAKLAEDLKELQCCEHDIYLISNQAPEKWDFDKLTKAIADSLPPPQKECFNKIPRVHELIALEKFQSFMKEVKEQEKEETSHFFSADDVKQMFLGSGIVGVQRMMKAHLERWKETKINLAILGSSGAGKSSFTNAIRGVKDDDKVKAAETGVIETTTIPTSYEHPVNPNIRFWDLPGIGTPNYPDFPTFCEKVAIEKYDTFLIITAERFKEYDLQLAKKVDSMGKSFFFVRTKIDNDLRSERRKAAFNEKTTLKRIRDDCADNLKGFDFGEEKIFLVSNYHPDKWDFDRLKKAILDQLPAKQKESLTMSLRTHSKDLLREKIKLLKGRVWMVASLSVVSKFGLGPLSLFVDGKLIRNNVKLYRSLLAFPDYDSEEFEKLTEDQRERVKKFHPKPDEDLLEWLQSFDHDNTYNIRMYRKLILTNKPFKFVYLILNLILDEMEKTALAIFDTEGDDDWE